MSDNISYTIPKLAELLRVNSAFIYRIIFIGKIKVNSNRITQQSINDYISKYGEYLERLRSSECLRR